MSDQHMALTYSDVQRRSAGFSEQLTDQGIGAGDTVAIKLPNRLELLIGIIGAWRVGATVTPINPTFTEPELDYQLVDSGAAVLLTDVPTALEIPTILVQHMRPTPTTAPPAPLVPAETIALLIYTSGSTGRPKGVMLDHTNLEAMTAQTVSAFDLTNLDHALTVLPLFHVNSIITGFLAPLSVGGRLTMLERFSPDAFARTINAHQPTYFSAVPAMYSRLVEGAHSLKMETHSLRFAICGAAPMSAELLQRVERQLGIQVLEGYGLTEATCASTINPLQGERRPGTVGLPLPGQRVAIMDENNHFLAPGEAGEIVIAGPTIMKGYHGRPAETAQTVRNGWLHTSDVGVLDDAGYLRILGRLKDMIIRGGENLYPAEIEKSLETHPDIQESAVVGAPDPVLGEVPVAYVVLRPGTTLSKEDLRSHCQASLMKIKIPTDFIELPQLPRNAMGKIDKPQLRTQLTNHLLPSTSA
jgi:acyl-CoA synthetase (AMP-forming)/AMP-acid ligase II